MPSLRASVFPLAGFVAGGLLFATLSAAPPAGVSGSTADSKIAQITQQRLELIDRGYEEALATYQHGFGPYHDVAVWVQRRAMVARDLDGEQRSKILRDCVQQLKTEVTEAQARHKVGAITHEQMLLVQDRELEVELWLAKAESK